MEQHKFPMQDDTLSNSSMASDSFSGSTGSTASRTSSHWSPEEVPQLTVDVYRKEDMIYIVSTVAGVNPADLDISIENNTLSIKGLRKKPYDEKSIDMLLEECFWGEFYRELTINENLDVAKIKADLIQGVLIIEIPILKLESQKKISVNFS